MSNPRRAFAGGREVGGGSPIWPAAAAVLAGLGVCWAETRWPLRRKRDSKRSRNVRNLVFAVLSAVTIQVLQEPIVGPLSRRVQSRRWGLLKQATLPPWLETGLALMLMDYTLYLWHVLTHRAPFLWRFHRPHHADLEMTPRPLCGSTSVKWRSPFPGGPPRSWRSACRPACSRSGSGSWC